MSGATMWSFIIAILCLFTISVNAHMVMSEPPPINYKTSPYYDVSKADFDYTAPLSPSGSNYPCRGMLKHLGTAVGQSVRTYSPGGTYDLKFDGSATHGGGSCQVALSYDRGSTWKVIKSFIGGCVGIQPGSSQTFQFTVPNDAPSGEALFGWTWFNNQGNREMYMNCAVVTIKGSRKMVKRDLSGPNMFIANVGNGCSTPPGTDVLFPNPGPNVQYGGDAGKRAAPIGDCGPMLYTPPPTNSGDNTGNTGGKTGGNTSTGTPTNNGNNNPTNPPSTDNPPTSRPKEGIAGGNEGLSRDCAYWKTQGYTCNGASRSLGLGSEEKLALVVVALAVVAMFW